VCVYEKDALPDDIDKVNAEIGSRVKKVFGVYFSKLSALLT
jgi:hypothetical protein